MSESYVARAAVVLVCGDSDSSIAHMRDALQGRVVAPIIVVRTKADIVTATAAQLTENKAALGASAALAVSAETGEGLGPLLSMIADVVSGGAEIQQVDAPLLTQERHRYAVTRALDEARAFRDQWMERRIPAPVAAVHLREAVMTLEDLIGAVDVDDVLDEVFRRFCVGK
jgi:tRNA modification GTPase